jgi:TRAP-type uncharacterized transport system substrate-binding protein
MERVMAVLGVTYADFALVTELPPEEQNEALCVGRVDAVVYVAGNPQRDRAGWDPSLRRPGLWR